MTTHSTPPRDARDTARRRARHKDGRLLRGGIGLTTGLGWSDRWVALVLFGPSSLPVLLSGRHSLAFTCMRVHLLLPRI